MRVESALLRAPWLGIVGVSCVFLLCASLKARRLPFTFDEILTEYVAALPSFDAIWKTLAAHAESSPPLFHLISKLSGHALGWNGLGLRFPAVVGYLLMMICVYFMVRRYVGLLYAAIAVFASFLTYAPFYATEARPYGLLLGLSALAALCWQAVTQYRARWIALVGLFVSLGLAFNLQYFAVLTLAAIALGELVRDWRLRRIDWAVWAALVLATTPLLFLRPLMWSNWVLKQGYFAPATVSQFVGGIVELYLPLGGILCAAFVVLVLACILSLGRPTVPKMSAVGPPVHELAAWVALLLAPIAAFIAGRLVLGVYVSRYSLVTVIGFSLLLPFCLQRLFQGSRAAALGTLAFLIFCFAARYGIPSKIENPSTGLLPWVKRANALQLPIVVADPGTYLQFVHSGSGELRDALVYIPDPKEALRYTGANSTDYNLAGLRSTGRLRLPEYSDFKRSHERFLVLWEISPFDWIMPRLREDGAQMRLCSAPGYRILVVAEFVASTEGSASGRKVDQVCDTGVSISGVER
ncbi:MAG: glycosyltransferase family 39 protein [Acidobacteriia bacterium]|nr:glycosyltransferase family 39 protein [Terriglobia bacterium]